MKILVTGCNGQLGHAMQEISTYLSEWTWKFTDLPELDITNPEQVNQTVKNFQPDWIINAAAYTDVDGAETNQELAFRVNAEGPHNLAKAVIEANAKLVHISTDYVFDGTKNEPYTETDQPNPLQVYGKSKLEGETLIQETGVLGIIIRTSWLYGTHGKNFVKTIIRLAEEKDEIQVVDDQIGSPTYVGDLAEVILELLSKHTFHHLELLHYSNEGGISWYEFAEKINLLCSLGCTIKLISSETLKQKAIRPSFTKLDVSQIKKKFQVIIQQWDDSLALFLNEKKF
ncbi:MAG: dTDP-4-dehydrorhamnose reductase [SAR324 cluster bacterium]|nr:dTDP-4-dehydrorhamnose reductase [SAR324 cluster bacterium]